MLTRLDSYSNMKSMLIARSIPYSPNILITALGAVSSLSFKAHFWATFIGKWPSVIIEVFLGHDLLNLAEHGLRFIFLVVLCIAGYFYMRWRKNSKNRNTALGLLRITTQIDNTLRLADDIALQIAANYQIIDAFSELQEYHDEKNYFVENTDVDYTIKQHLISYMLKNISVQKKLIHKNILLIQLKNRRTIFSSPRFFIYLNFGIQQI